MNILAALFEVMDKEPSLLEVWILFLTLGIGGFLLCRYRRWMLAVVLPLIFFCIYGHLMELHDPSVGPAIVREAGQSYVTQSSIVTALAVSLPFLGIVMSRKRLP
jgi:hypothetical protein